MHSQIIAQIVYSAGIDADNSWSENVVLTVLQLLPFHHWVLYN